MFSPEADIFFEPPNTRPNQKGTFGVLHLLRKDIYLCMGYDPVNRQKTSHSTLWPGAMAVLAGIDLLAKFFAGSDQSGQVGPRFRAFIHKYFTPISQGDEDVLYQLRNALLHSFGLYSNNKGKEYFFLLSMNPANPLIKQAQQDRYIVDLYKLHESFEKAVKAYQTEIDSDKNLQTNFLSMFPHYGAIEIG